MKRTDLIRSKVLVICIKQGQERFVVVIGVVDTLLLLVKNANDRSHVEQHCGCLQGQDGC